MVYQGGGGKIIFKGIKEKGGVFGSVLPSFERFSGWGSKTKSYKNIGKGFTEGFYLVREEKAE